MCCGKGDAAVRLQPQQRVEIDRLALGAQFEPRRPAASSCASATTACPCASCRAADAATTATTAPYSRGRCPAVAADCRSNPERAG
jgi:hypothetical protein